MSEIFKKSITLEYFKNNYEKLVLPVSDGVNDKKNANYLIEAMTSNFNIDFSCIEYEGLYYVEVFHPYVINNEVFTKIFDYVNNGHEELLQYKILMIVAKIKDKEEFDLFSLKLDKIR